MSLTAVLKRVEFLHSCEREHTGFQVGPSCTSYFLKISYDPPRATGTFTLQESGTEFPSIAIDLLPFLLKYSLYENSKEKIFKEKSTIITVEKLLLKLISS